MTTVESLSVSLQDKFRELNSEGFSLVFCLTKNKNGEGKTSVMVDKSAEDLVNQIIVNLLASSCNMSRHVLEEIERMMKK